MSGRTLPAGSLLVQFEVNRPHGGSWPELPGSPTQTYVLWVDRRPIACWACGKASFFVPTALANSAMEGAGSPLRYSDDPVICSTMGRFVE